MDFIPSAGGHRSPRAGPSQCGEVSLESPFWWDPTAPSSTGATWVSETRFLCCVHSGDPARRGLHVPWGKASIPVLAPLRFFVWGSVRGEVLFTPPQVRYDCASVEELSGFVSTTERRNWLIRSQQICKWDPCVRVLQPPYILYMLLCQEFPTSCYDTAIASKNNYWRIWDLGSWSRFWVPSIARRAALHGLPSLPCSRAHLGKKRAMAYSPPCTSLEETGQCWACAGLTIPSSILEKKEENSAVKSCTSPIASNKREKEKYCNVNPYMTV